MASDLAASTHTGQPVQLCRDGTVTLIEKCSGAVGFEAVATEHRWVVHISGGSVGRGDLTPDREAVGHLGSPFGRPEQMPSVNHRRSKYLNNRAENSQSPRPRDVCGMQKTAHDAPVVAIRQEGPTSTTITSPAQGFINDQFARTQMSEGCRNLVGFMVTRASRN